MVNNSPRPQKAAMLIAQRIINDAIKQGLGPGDLLSAEKSMLETYGTGRGTLREALRLLEVQGVISLKPGPKGGPVLQTPDASHLSSTVILLMQLKEAPFRSIVEVRSAMEPMISRLAAERISNESLDELGATIQLMSDDMDDEDTFLEANKRFHDVIAWSSGNPLFGYLVESLLGIMDGTVIGIDYPPIRRKAILKAHGEIFKALTSRDPKQSEERMREHIQEYVTYAERKFPNVLGQVIRWGSIK
ncbi:FadR/GntR family transcriptional regulator [Nonomuraea cavernae]|uniref:FadR/GntR family transcriptional regulator n=1 Tax=Nonomuraea cavernae TaxID=2045107 RepID=UPI0033E4F17D